MEGEVERGQVVSPGLLELAERGTAGGPAAGGFAPGPKRSLQPLEFGADEGRQFLIAAEIDGNLPAGAAEAEVVVGAAAPPVASVPGDDDGAAAREQGGVLGQQGFEGGAASALLSEGFHLTRKQDSWTRLQACQGIAL